MQFSSTDINDAKQRVYDMRRKAQNYVSESQQPDSEFDDATQTPNIADDNNNVEPPKQNNFGNNLFSFGDEQNDSFVLVLLLILVLSNEGADNILILALLYILL